MRPFLNHTGYLVVGPTITKFIRAGEDLESVIDAVVDEENKLEARGELAIDRDDVYAMRLFSKMWRGANVKNVRVREDAGGLFDLREENWDEQFKLARREET